MTPNTLPLQIVSVVVVLCCKSKYLLVKRNENDDIFPGKWQNLGGKVEIGECVEDAIQREIYEEIGLRVSNKPIFIQSYSWKKDADAPVRLGLVFLINLERNPTNHEIKLSEELSDFKWFSEDDIKKLEKADQLIGKGRPKGTFGQIKRVLAI